MRLGFVGFEHGGANGSRGAGGRGFELKMLPKAGTWVVCFDVGSALASFGGQSRVPWSAMRADPSSFPFDGSHRRKPRRPDDLARKLEGLTARELEVLQGSRAASRTPRSPPSSSSATEL